MTGEIMNNTLPVLDCSGFGACCMTIETQMRIANGGAE